MKKQEICAIIHNVRSAHNVGSMFRTADGAGISKLYLTGYTPAPTDRAGNFRAEISKVALGAEKTVPWEYRKSLAGVIVRLRRKGFSIVALEQSSQALDYRFFKPAYPFAFIVGNEVRGLDSSILRASDTVVEIPMSGSKESLNVSVAFGIAAFQFRGSEAIRKRKITKSSLP